MLCYLFILAECLLQDYETYTCTETYLLIICLRVCIAYVNTSFGVVYCHTCCRYRREVLSILQAVPPPNDTS